MRRGPAGSGGCKAQHQRRARLLVHPGGWAKNLGAARKWPGSGVPDQPLAWLTTTARHRAIDRMRRASTEAAKLREVAAMDLEPPPSPNDSEIPDARLELMFTCCHPSLNLDAQV